MTEFTRRRFLRHTSIGVAGVGIAATGAAIIRPHGAPAPAPAHSSAAPGQPDTALPHQAALEADTLVGPMLVHVRDVSTAEIGVLVGTREIVYRDPELVARLVQSAGQAARAAG